MVEKRAPDRWVGRAVERVEGPTDGREAVKAAAPGANNTADRTAELENFMAILYMYSGFVHHPANRAILFDRDIGTSSNPQSRKVMGTGQKEQHVVLWMEETSERATNHARCESSGST